MWIVYEELVRPKASRKSSGEEPKSKSVAPLYLFIGSVLALVVAAWVLAIIIWGYLLSVASQIFRCALFLYASNGTLPEPYTEEMMALAWKHKKS